ncbi:HAD family hydrolase [Micromonospora sp. DT46]|uniref:HAD family hydrolase n=1 Tax=unclassified Micromonospora TaxID=2617518 RepID=UPI002E1132A5|nr:HAD family phosphatase [Micromonospora sp. NBC_01740]
MASGPVPVFAGVLFDLDGVLIDSTEAILSLWRGLAAEHDRALSASAIRDDVLGCSPEHSVSALFGDLDADTREEILRRVRVAETDLAFVEVPGAREILATLGGAGVRLALVTGASARRARRVVAHLGVAAAFDAMVTWGETARGKPAPDCYLLAARRLGLAPAGCLVVEDAPSGVRAASSAGAVTVGVGDAPALRAAGATWTAPDLAALSVARAAGAVELRLAGAPIAGLSTVAGPATLSGTRA